MNVAEVGIQHRVACPLRQLDGERRVVVGRHPRRRPNGIRVQGISRQDLGKRLGGSGMGSSSGGGGGGSSSGRSGMVLSANCRPQAVVVPRGPRA